MENILLELENFISKTQLDNELDLELSMVINKHLRLISKNNKELKQKRKTLINLITNYENKYWKDSTKITAEQIEESLKAEELVKEKNNIYKKEINEYLKNNKIK